MSTAFWTAVGCAVAGAAIGGMLPSIGYKVAHGRPGNARAVSGRSPRVHAVVASVTTAVFMGWFGYQQTGLTLVAWCWLTITGVCLAAVDVECGRLPRPLAAAMAAGGLVTLATVAVVEVRPGSLLRALLASVLVLAVMAGIAVIAPCGLGGGDATLVPALALYLGWCGWTTVLQGLFVGAALTVVVLVVLVVSGRAGWGTRVVAGPTHILGALVVIAVGVDTGAT